MKLLKAIFVATLLLTVAVVGAQKVRLAVSAHSATLTWTAATVPNGGAPVTSYNVYRGTTSGSETLLASAGNVLTYTDSAVTAGTQYFYEVTAFNSAGESAKSNEISGTIPNPVAPNPPVLNSVTVQ
jgi:fibronectin type 3 domain-containing protein